jgi:solute carrier family 13 (sodium-dependent dicarboxylate transporter), member 2/3/5
MHFSNWMMLTAPLVLLMLVILWFILNRFYPSTQATLPLKLEGKFLRSPHAIIMYLVFALTIVLWVTESLHGIPSGLVAFIPVALLPTFGVIERKDIRSLPWEVLWLMAGGIALGVAMGAAGLAEWMVGLVPWSALGAAGILAAFGAVAILLATFIANTVAATLLIPIMMSLVASGVGDGFAVQSAALMVALGASLGMSLPISTPPNAIAISTGMVDSSNMAKVGIMVGIAGYLALLASAFFFWNLIF